MTRSDRLGELFERALELPIAGRDAFLADACGDDSELRRELRSLLDAHEAEPEYLERIGRRIFGGTGEVLPDLADGRYRVLERIGEGGMGVVFKAHDTSLDRPVALKFLPPHLLADEEARTRLRSEARAASALDHPNIAVVHEIGSARLTASDPESGRLYLAMGFYDGETLDRRIASGRVPVHEVLDVATQMAAGLARAHEAGIVHRDVKPANLIVTERGTLKILDFGIARADGRRLTGKGARLGTLAYMSPEQTRGETVDARSDVWSAGVVLYELLAGRHPFAADDEAATVFGIRHDAPVPLTTLRDDVPASLVRLVERCLEKEPEGRPVDGGALLEELRATLGSSGQGSVGTKEAERPSLVVLPFVNLSPEPENEFFSDGMTEEVIADLSRVRSLRVISRTSSMRLKHDGRGMRDVARELGVEYALEGSVRKAGNSLRITAQLVDARRDAQVWSASFDGSLDDVFEIQTGVARAIVDALRVRLTPGERAILAAHPIQDPRAYESYLRARYEAWRFSPESLERARRYVETALDIVGDNELLYATLGHLAVMRMESGVATGEDDVRRIREIADRVLALNPRSGRAQWLRAFVAFQSGDLAGAIDAGERALAAEPDEPDFLMLHAYVLAHAGRNGEATAMMARALAVDPLTPLTQGMQGLVPVLEGRFDAGAEAYAKQREMDPESPFAVFFHGWALAYARRTEEAIEAFEATHDDFPGTVFAPLARSFALALGGRSPAALEAITPALAAAGRQSEMLAREIAHCYALAGDVDRALEWLEREIDLGMLNLDYLAEHDWFLDGLRDDPRFGALLDSVRRELTKLEAGR